MQHLYQDNFFKRRTYFKTEVILCNFLIYFISLINYPQKLFHKKIINTSLVL